MVNMGAARTQQCFDIFNKAGLTRRNRKVGLMLQIFREEAVCAGQRQARTSAAS